MFHVRVWLSFPQPAFQRIAKCQWLFSCTCSCLFRFERHYEMWVVETIVRPPYDILYRYMYIHYMCIYVYMYVCMYVYLSIYLSLSLYIYIYMSTCTYIHREREREIKLTVNYRVTAPQGCPSRSGLRRPPRRADPCYMCINLYIYIYIHIYIYIYIHANSCLQLIHIHIYSYA